MAVALLCPSKVVHRVRAIHCALVRQFSTEMGRGQKTVPMDIPRTNSSYKATKRGFEMRYRHGAARRSSWQQSAGLLSAATIGVGAANYLMSAAAVRLLPAHAFDLFAAGQGLLLVLGTGSLAALPWAIARYLARTETPDALQLALGFGMTGAVAQGLVLAPVAGVICWRIGDASFGWAAAAAALWICLLAGPMGFLQGVDRLPSIGAVRVVETAARIACSLALVLLVSRSAAVALLGFPIGSCLALGLALWFSRAGLPLRRAPRALAVTLTRESARLGAIQVLLAMLAALDTVYVSTGHFSDTTVASYQAAALVARIPLFFSAALSTAAYTALAAAPDESAAGGHLRDALRTYAWLAAALVLGCMVVPRSVLDLVVPARYTQTLPTLRLLCIAGVLIGAINVVTTGHQARGRYGRCTVVLTLTVVAQAVVLIAAGHTGDLSMYAAGEIAVAAIALVGLLIDAAPWLRTHGFRIRPITVGYAGIAVALAVGAGFVTAPALWLSIAALAFLVCARAGFSSVPHPAPGRQDGEDVTRSVDGDRGSLGSDGFRSTHRARRRRGPSDPVTLLFPDDYIPTPVVPARSRPEVPHISTPQR